MKFKSASEALDFVQDWALELGVDIISTSTWTLDSGITLDSDENDTTTATAWVSGGTAGQTYKVVNEIVTAAGRTFSREWYLRIQDQRAG